jgi:hypothetical protein
VANSYDFLRTLEGCLWLVFHVETSFILILSWAVSNEVYVEMY